MIEINGNEYPVRYSMKALKKFERKAKVNVFSLSDPSKLSADACAFLCFVGVECGCNFSTDGPRFRIFFGLFGCLAIATGYDSGCIRVMDIQPTTTLTKCLLVSIDPPDGCISGYCHEMVLNLEFALSADQQRGC